MRRTLIKQQHGFSLVELAVSMMVIGVLLVPALHAYTLYLADQKRERTTEAVESAERALNNFREIYGYYPCPARADLTLGDADYGDEVRAGPNDCATVGGGIWQVTSANTDLSAPPINNDEVYIGTIPFRALNLPFQIAYDGEGNQLTYAVTEVLTSSATYANNRGGIRVVDVDGNPLIDQDGVPNSQNSAHYVILSHGEGGTGAYARTGNLSSACPGVLDLENENCDRSNATFRGGAHEDEFNDIVTFSTADSVKQWQTADGDFRDIHLKQDKTSFAIGAGIDEDTSGFATVEVSLDVVDDATVLVEDTASAADLGVVRSNQLCTNGGTDCFRPDLIAGQVADESLTCVGNPSGRYLIGIRNGVPVCTDEVSFNCPTGEFITGFDSDGAVICDTQPPLACPDQMLTTTCGATRNVSSFFQGGSYWGYAFSGECHRLVDTLDNDDIDDILDDYDSTDPNFYDPGQGFDQAMAEIRAHLDDLNDDVRNTEDCGPTGLTALVRDTYRCNNGVWNTSPAYETERLETTEDFSSFGPTYQGGSHRAEAPGAAYNPSSPMSVDPNNTNNHRDCWCREDYRLVTQGCGGSLTGQRFRIDFHRCPATDHNQAWRRVYPSSGSWNTSLCGCSASSSGEQMSCAAYFGYSGPGIDGEVDFTRDTTCSGSTPVTTDHSHDASDCHCPVGSPPTNTRTVACPFGYTNSFNYDGTDYVGIAEIHEEDWVCPTGTPGSAATAPVSSAGDAGYYGAETLVHTEACTCDSALTQTHHEACPAGFQGSGTTWELAYDCVAGSFEAPSDANKVSEDCNRCIWQAGTPRSAGETFSYAAEYEVGSDCASCSGTGSCYEVVGTDEFKIWDGCYCAGQP